MEGLNERREMQIEALKSGRREMCIARCIGDFEYFDPDTKQIRRVTVLCVRRKQQHYLLDAAAQMP